MDRQGEGLENIKIITDSLGNKVVLLSEIIFTNKQSIDWDEVEKYLNKYVNQFVKITESNDIVYIGRHFPNEYSGSKYTRKTKGARTKAKANAVQGILEMLEIASEKSYRENHKEKHTEDAGKGWYYYKTRFALPIYKNETKTNSYNLYTACMVINCTARGKMFLYDVVDIKKEASNPLKTT
ncbi:MAG: hypothetical protein PHP50_06370 [Lachnospiraceae bacterium]|nr:hypothetical protein [Lachnospiraceae bacterium]